MAGVITDIVPHPKRAGWVVIQVEGRDACRLPVEETAQLEPGQTLTETELARLQEIEAYYEAKELALGYLARRPRSTAEVGRYLRQKGFASTVIERVIARLQALGYLDDRAFAAFWVEQRTTFRPRGRMALRHELRQKGIPDAVIDEALSQVDEEASAWAALRPQLRRWQHLDWPTFREKAAAYLARRGFPYDIIRDVVWRAWHEREGASSDVSPVDDDR